MHFGGEHRKSFKTPRFYRDSRTVIEAKRSSINAADAAGQARHYATLAKVLYIFLANGREIRLWEWQAEAHPRPGQMRGRGTRKSPGKPCFTMFDFVGVTDYHLDDETYAEGGEMKARQPQKRGDPRRLVTVDADDWIDPTTRAWVTYDAEGNVVYG